MRHTKKTPYRLLSCCLFRKDRQPPNKPNEIELSGVINSTQGNKKPQLKNSSKNTRDQLNKMQREAKKRTDQRTQNNKSNALPNTNQQPECQQTTAIEATTHIKYGNLANALDKHANGTTDRTKTTAKAKTTENSHRSPQHPTTEGSVFVHTESHLMHNIPTLAADLSRKIEERRNKKQHTEPEKMWLGIGKNDGKVTYHSSAPSTNESQLAKDAARVVATKTAKSHR